MRKKQKINEDVLMESVKVLEKNLFKLYVKIKNDYSHLSDDDIYGIITIISKWTQNLMLDISDILKDIDNNNPKLQ